MRNVPNEALFNKEKIILKKQQQLTTQTNTIKHQMEMTDETKTKEKI